MSNNEMYEAYELAAQTVFGVPYHPCPITCPEFGEDKHQEFVELYRELTGQDDVYTAWPD